MVSSPVLAAPDAGAIELHSRAGLQVEQALRYEKSEPARAAAFFAEAAMLYAEAAGRVPETATDRALRADFLGKAVRSALEAHRLDPSQPKPLQDALLIIEAHIEALQGAYSDGAQSLPEYQAAQERMNRVQTALGPVEPPSAHNTDDGSSVPHAHAAPVDPPGPPPTTGPKDGIAGDREGQPIGPAKGDVDRITVGEPPPKASRARPDWRRVMFGTSLGLTGISLGAAIATASQVSRKPFQGELYQDIVNAAFANGLPTGPQDELCLTSSKAKFADLRDACDARDKVARAAIAMTTLTVVFAASSVTFGVLMTRSKRPRTVTFRERQPGFAFVPLSSGVFVGGGARF